MNWASMKNASEAQVYTDILQIAEFAEELFDANRRNEAPKSGIAAPTKKAAGAR